jgi:hypothetical protein
VRDLSDTKALLLQRRGRCVLHWQLCEPGALLTKLKSVCSPLLPLKLVLCSAGPADCHTR